MRLEMRPVNIGKLNKKNLKTIQVQRARRRAIKTWTQQEILLFFQAHGLQPTPEFRFSKTRDWRVDYYFQRADANECREVALEVEGGVYSGGRHVRPKGFLKDMEKYNALSCQGIYLLRVIPSELCTQETIDMVKTCLNFSEG